MWAPLAELTNLNTCRRCPQGLTTVLSVTHNPKVSDGPWHVINCTSGALVFPVYPGIGLEHDPQHSQRLETTGKLEHRQRTASYWRSIRSPFHEEVPLRYCASQMHGWIVDWKFYERCRSPRYDAGYLCRGKRAGSMCINSAATAGGLPLKHSFGQRNECAIGGRHNIDVGSS